MTAALFGARPGSADGAAHDDEQHKQRAFIKLKAICVPLAAAAKDAATRDRFQLIVDLLKKLQSEISSVPDNIFTPALANYVFFPLASLLSPPSDKATRPQSDTILEHAMIALESIVRKWRLVGMDTRVLHELWTMVILQLGGPLDPNGPNGKQSKGKAIERTEECSLAMIKVLLVLAGDVYKTSKSDSSDEEDFLGENIDWDAGPEPMDRSRKFQSRKVDAPPSPRVPIVFHTLTTVLDLAARPSALVALQLTALQVLELILFQHLARSGQTVSSTESFIPGPAPLLATALPGTASTLCRTALSLPASSMVELMEQTRQQHSSVVVATLRLLGQLLLATIGDSITSDLRPRQQQVPVHGLQELAASMSQSALEGDSAKDKLENSTTSLRPSITAGPTRPSPSWLRYTVESVSALISSLGPLSKHDNPTVRQALAQLLSDLLDCAFETLSPTRELLIEGLLILAGDDWPSVSVVAEASLESTLQRTAESGTLPAQDIVAIVKKRMSMLPTQLRKGDNAAVTRSARIMQSALRFANGVSGGSANAMASALQSIEKWSWAVLDSIEIDDSAARTPLSAGGTADSRTRLAWTSGAGAGAIDTTLGTPLWPTIRLRDNQGDDSPIRSLNDMWTEFGRAAATNGQDGVIVDSFLSTATGVKKWDTAGISALWALNAVLQGMQDDPVTKRRRKLINLVVKSMLDLLDELDQVSYDDRGPLNGSINNDNVAVISNDHEVVIERARVISHTPALDGLKPVSSARAHTQDKQQQNTTLQCWALRVLSTTAAMLQQEFQPHLLRSLYHVLARMSPSTNVSLRGYAQASLSSIAESLSYASPRNLVLANVDYVVNSVSQRLSVGRLDPDAPLVLVEMIRLAGSDIVPMVQDLVEDVFEALDDYHGYDQITLSLWAVMDALMRVMDEQPRPIAATSEAMGIPQIKAAVDPAAEWEAFLECFAHGRDAASQESAEDDVLRDNPQKPFGPIEDDMDEPENEAGMPSEPERAPATRHQQVASHIIAKATYFLSHHSPFLRARVLSLMATAVPLLVARSQPDDSSSSRQSDLLPVVHRAWPHIINRFSDTNWYVIIEASLLVETLASHVGEFMSRRIIDDVWPLFRALLDKRIEVDKQLASGADSRYTVSHRLYLSILKTVGQVIKHVPVKEDVSWDMCWSMRRFLVADKHAELQDAALALYGELARLKPDCVWLVLRGAAGQCGLPAFLQVKGELSDGVDDVLSLL
ncbi:hypothetical protein OIV83_001686 [Microbotryomycetes sp. JL201]|nr:hypothetical protein OIV83_001686 [Microbotryomycetes sp. JL201]